MTEQESVTQVQLMERILQAKLSHIKVGEIVFVQINNPNLTAKQIIYIGDQLEDVSKKTGIEFVVIDGDIMVHKDEEQLKKIQHLISKRLKQINVELV